MVKDLFKLSAGVMFAGLAVDFTSRIVDRWFK